MEWTPIRIPTALYNQVTNTIQENPEQGYTNEHEFIRDAVREKLEKTITTPAKEANPT